MELAKQHGNPPSRTTYGYLIGAFAGALLGWSAGMAFLLACNYSLTPIYQRPHGYALWRELFNTSQGPDMVIPAVMTLVAAAAGAWVGHYADR